MAASIRLLAGAIGRPAEPATGGGRVNNLNLSNDIQSGRLLLLVTTWDYFVADEVSCALSSWVARRLAQQIFRYLRRQYADATNS